MSMARGQTTYDSARDIETQRQNYFWIPALTTILGSIASILFLIYFPWLIPNLGWPGFLAATTALIPSLFLLSNIPGDGQSRGGDIGGCIVLFGSVTFGGIGFMSGLGFILTATPAALATATVISTNIILAIAGGFLSLCTGFLIADDLAHRAVRNANQDRAGENREEEKREETPIYRARRLQPTSTPTNEAKNDQGHTQRTTSTTSPASTTRQLKSTLASLPTKTKSTPTRTAGEDKNSSVPPAREIPQPTPPVTSLSQSPLTTFRPTSPRSAALEASYISGGRNPAFGL
jgi:hypothetical protein